ncbi:MAG: oligosaccharide flippase family protein [Actinomycetota bacterium]|nr:oligosaccharide flippase family protein [Actinomycetota bacterium]
MGIAVLIQGFNNIAILYLHKELEFQKVFKYQFLGTLADFAVVVVSVFFLRSVWALVLGLLAGNLTRCIMSYVIEPYRPKLQIIGYQARELFTFGKWITVSGILIFLITQGDDIFVGILLGATTLGFYQMAYRISNIPATEVTNIISKVSFPLYSKLQGEPDKLKYTYTRVLQLVSFITFPISAAILVLAPEFTIIFLGEQWMPIVPAIQVLVMAGLIRSLFTTMIPLFIAVGKPKIETRWQIIRFVVIAGLIYPLTARFGIVGTSIAVLVSVVLATIGLFAETVKEIKVETNKLIKLIGLSLLGGVILALSAYGLKFIINSETILGLAIIVFIILLIFAGLNYLYDRFLGYHISLILNKGIRAFLEK